MNFLLTPQAEEELAEAASYYKKKASAAIATAFIAEFKRAMTIVMQNQQIGTRAEAGMRIYPFRRFPYSIVYEEMTTGPIVYAVANQRRQPKYWLDRL